MTVEEAVEIRDRAITLGLESCCETCADAIERLRKLGTTGDWTIIPSGSAKEPTIGLGQEEAVRYLRRQIGAAA